ncbi:four helix bundle protein [Roseivirga sp.]|nr:four helix bundle protein [Roseivirga sp.]
MKLEELNVYNQANVIADEVWQIVESWDYFKKDTLGKQLVRSADSISANIAEGYGRYFFKENRNFCYYSRGSLLETKNWIGKAYRRQIIDQENHDNLVKELDQLHKSLNGYIKYITESSRKES